MPSPTLEIIAGSDRTESEVRALIRAKLLAYEAFIFHSQQVTAGKSIDARIDIEIESRRLWAAYEAACNALYTYERKQKDVT